MKVSMKIWMWVIFFMWFLLGVINGIPFGVWLFGEGCR